MRSRLCPICRMHPVESALAWCASCGASFDRATRRDDGTLLAAILWGARRARRFALAERNRTKVRTRT